MDRKSIIILVLCGLLFVLWAEVTKRLYPSAPASRTNTVDTATNRLASTTNGAPALEAPRAANTPPVAPTEPEKLFVLTNETARYTFTSHGGGLKQVDLLKYPESVSCARLGKQANKSLTNRVATLNSQAETPILSLGGVQGPLDDDAYALSVFTEDRPVPGATNSVQTHRGVRAEKRFGNGFRVVKEFELTSNYLMQVRVRVENYTAQPLVLRGEDWVAGAATPLNAQDDEQLVGLHWYDGRSDKQIGIPYFDNKTLGCFAGRPLTEYRADSSVAWVAAHNQFFFLALIPKSAAQSVSATRYHLPVPSPEEVAADSRTRTNQFAIQVNLHYAATNIAPGQAVEREFMLFAGPKEYRTLERISMDLNSPIDRIMGYGGFFGFFSRLLLLSMNGLNALGLSYGLAIIAITVIIKLLFWPLTQASTRSMKRMQALQPQMKAIQEKFKDDPTKMNRRMMEFMKENKVSPLGGCLPLLLQIPVFIGFFKMVQSAIELRGASFLWACDLSKPDTLLVIPGINFNVNPLPLLMGGTMLWQAQLTPPSPGMDPMQQKIMRYLPLIFLFLLYNYSAGLTLYWTVQNLLSIAQMKLTKATENKKGSGPAPAPPSSARPAPTKNKRK